MAMARVDLRSWKPRRQSSWRRKSPAWPRHFPGASLEGPIPAGYYSGDQPNPNLRWFVAENATPYDPENDDYRLRAFNQPIETTKATAIHNMHGYIWARSRTMPSGSTSATTPSRATSCSTPSAGRVERPCPPCLTVGRRSPSIAVRPRRSSPRIIAHLSTRTNFDRRFRK